MPGARYGSLPFPQQIRFMRRKLKLSTRAWTDIYTHENDWSFVVAGANRDALVTDFFNAVNKTIEEGTTIEQFRKDFDAIVARHGWDYKGGRNWRSRVIYDTNLTQSYNAGRYEQLRAHRDALPYLRYRHNAGEAHPRPLHQSWDGLLLPADDGWWDAHFPANGWGCQCYVEGLSEDDVHDENLKVHKAPPVEYEERTIGQHSPNGARTVRVPKGVDPGFEYTPGKTRLESAVPRETPFRNPAVRSRGLPNRTVTDALPAPRALPESGLLPQGLSDTDYANAFLHEFGASLDHDAIYRDVLGDALVIGKDLVWDRRHGRLKADKRGRGQYLPLLAQVIKSPDEIWVRVEHHAARDELMIRRRYLARFTLPDRPLPALAVFEKGDDTWSGITIFNPEDYDVNDLRVGVRLYKRGEEADGE